VLNSTRPEEFRGRRADKKPSARREELLQIALELFASDGYHNTGVRDIADRAQIASGSLFYHFTSKESMLEELMAPYFRTLLDRCLAVVQVASGGEAILRLIEATIATISEGMLRARVGQRDWSVVASNFPEIVAIVETVDSIWMAILEQGAKDGEFRSDVDPKITYNMLKGALSGTVSWYTDGGEKTTAEIASIYSLVLLDGIWSR
jgi:TetR/AcrR family transcriptional regulator, cholesterol catabolism regulator